MPTTQQCFSHCYPRDLSNNSALIYSILLIPKINPAPLVPIHCQKKEGAGQDLHVTSPSFFRLQKVIGCGKFSLKYRHGGRRGNPYDKGEVSKQHPVSPSGLKPLLLISLGPSVAHPASSSLLSLGRHLALLEQEEEETLPIPHASFSFFLRGKGGWNRRGALPSRVEDRRKLSAPCSQLTPTPTVPRRGPSRGRSFVSGLGGQASPSPAQPPPGEHNERHG